MTELPEKTPPHGGDVYLLARTLGVNIGDLLDFSANVNPLGFPPGLTGAVEEARQMGLAIAAELEGRAEVERFTRGP